MPLDPSLQDLVAGGPWQRAAAPFGLVDVRGPDAADFLQRLCSQDVAGLAAGGLAPAAFLDGKGKLQATCLVGRLADGFVLEAQAAQVERLLALLDRYHVTEKLTFGARPTNGCAEQVAVADGPAAAVTAGADGTIELAFVRRGLVFRRRHGGGAAPAAFAGQPLDDDRAECLRMIAGFVRVGVESEPTTLALEADLGDHCSTTKGCYTGQEIVARIHTYGHVNRQLSLLRLPAGKRVAAPVALHEPEDDLAVGRVMHAVPAPGGGASLGLGYLPEDFRRPGTALRLAGGGDVTVLAFAN
jgi:folate-binding protein YgfZ